MYVYHKVKYEAIKAYRKIYLESLSELQELFIEWLVKTSDYYTMTIESKIIGYAIVSKHNTLVEFWIDLENVQKGNEIFIEIKEKLEIRKVLCKSFDSLLLQCCLENKMKYNSIGYLFREYIDTDIQDNNEFTKIEFANENDYLNLVTYDNDLYETKEELIDMLKHKNIIKYYIDDTLIGCGFMIKVTDIPVAKKPTFKQTNVQYDDHYDIGMWVDTPYRRKGYATKILSDIKKRCIEKGITPTCGCASDNVASKKTLERNGFRSTYSLLEFSTNEDINNVYTIMKENC